MPGGAWPAPDDPYIYTTAAHGMHLNARGPRERFRLPVAMGTRMILVEKSSGLNVVRPLPCQVAQKDPQH